MSQLLKTAGIIGLGIVAILASLAVPMVLIYGSVFVAERLMPLASAASQVAFGVCLNFLLPLCLFRFTRGIAAVGLMIASYVFGAALWLTGVAVVYNYWGMGGLFVGLVFAGVGVVPIGLLASALQGEWLEVASFVFGLVLTFGARALAVYLAHKMDRDMMPRNHSLAWAGKAYVGVAWLVIAFGYGTTLYYQGWEFFLPGPSHFNIIVSFIVTMLLMLPGLALIKLGELFERRRQLRAPVIAA